MPPAAETIIWHEPAVDQLRDLGLSAHVDEIKRLVEKFNFEPMPEEFGYTVTESNGSEWHLLTIRVPNHDEIPVFNADFDEPLPPSTIVLRCIRRTTDSDADSYVRAMVCEVKSAAELIRR